MDHPSCQSRPRQCRRLEGRRTPGQLRVDDRHHGRALFSRARAQRPGCGQAACRTGAARHPLSARQPEPRAAPEFPWLRWNAKLSEPDQGQHPRRLLDRFGRPRRRDHGLCQPGAGLSDGARLDGRGGSRAVRGADRRCRTRRGQYLRMPDRGLQARHPQLLVDRRLQPAEPRCDLRGSHVRTVRRDLPIMWLADGRASLWQEIVGCNGQASGHRGMAQRAAERRSFRPALPGRSGVAYAHRGRSGQEGGSLPQGARRRGARPADERPRRPLHGDCWSKRSTRPRTMSRRCSSPGRSRASACPSPATRTITRA